MFNETKFSNKGNNFKFAASEGISDITLMGVATEYKTNVSRKYKTLSARLLEQTVGSISEIFTSVKYDGEGVYIFFDAEKDICTAFNAPSGRARIGLLCTEAVKTKLSAAGIKKALLVAEIYVKDSQRTQVGDVIRITFNGSKEERDRLTLAVYDIIMLDGKDWRNNQADFEKTREKISELIGEDTSQPVHLVKGCKIPGTESGKWFKEVTEDMGQEGIVIRNLQTSDIYKVKPSITIDTVIIGYVEGDFEGMYGITSLLCGVYDKASKRILSLTRVGSGFSDEQRKQLLEPLSKLKVSAPIDMTDSDGRPITFVKPATVVEVEGESLVLENYHGKINTTQKFLWDGKDYKFEGLFECPLLTHATFARFREDKEWDDGGTRIEQVLSPGTIAQLDKSSTEEGEPEVILREVYVKEAKGEKTVRKIVVVKTNQSSRFPFAVVWTDFSPNRKDPLKVETKVANTESRVDELVADYRIEANKKGWEKVV